MSYKHTVDHAFSARALSEAILQDYCEQMSKLTGSTVDEIKNRITKASQQLLNDIENEAIIEDYKAQTGDEELNDTETIPSPQEWEKNHRQDVD